MAFENIVGAQARAPLDHHVRFGLVHGFGFSFLLSERLQFAGSHLLTSLLAFNVGVEIGQLLVLVIAIPAAGVDFPVRRRAADRHDSDLGARRPHRVALDDRARRSAAGSIAGRGSTCRMSPSFMRLAMVIVAAAFLMWLMSLWIGRRSHPRDNPREEPTQSTH